MSHARLPDLTAGRADEETMYRGHTAGVVIPAYNEEGFVGDAIASVPDFVDRVYVVEDGSTDGTWDEIRERAASVNARADGDATAERFETRVVPVRHERNRGVGGAIKTGYLHAREDGVELTAVMGGDGQMEPEMLGELFDPIVEGRADYTKGNRLMGRSDRGRMPRFRFVGNAVLTALTKVASGYWHSGDPQSGYTAISLRALERVDVEGMYEFYGYCNDLLVKLNVARMRVADVPRPITYGDEESHIDYRTYVPRVSWMLFRNFLWRLRTRHLAFDFHPVALAYPAGAVATLVGALAFVWALPGVGTTGTPLFRGVVALLLSVAGAGMLVGAMALDIRANEHLDGTRRPPDASAAPADPDPASDSADRSSRTTDDAAVGLESRE
jgi:glycosyltransferase involved in cell wall biosynthesis